MKTYVVSFGKSNRITGTDFIEANSFDHAFSKANTMCSKYEDVLYIDEYVNPYQDKDLLDYESIEVI